MAACADRSSEARSWATRSARRIELSRRDHGVEQPGLPGRLRVEHVTGHRGVIEVRGGETVPGEHDGEPGQGEADPDLVEPQLEGAVGTDTHVGRHQEEGAGGKAWPVQATTTGAGKDEDALGQRSPRA